MFFILTQIAFLIGACGCYRRTIAERQVLDGLLDDKLRIGTCLKILRYAEDSVESRIVLIEKEREELTQALSLSCFSGQLPQLPMEVLLNILGQVPHSKFENWWPHVILDPSIRLTTRLDVRSLSMTSIAKIIDLTGVDFYIYIGRGDAGGWEMLKVLAQFPDRWKKLNLLMHRVVGLSSLWNACGSGILHVETLYLDIDESHVAEMAEVMASTVQERGTNWRTASFHPLLLPFFCDTGLLNSVTKLTLTTVRHANPWNPLKEDSLHVLSSLPALHELRLVYLDRTSSSGSVCRPVTSRSLRSLYFCTDDVSIAANCFSLFESCAINTLCISDFWYGVGWDGTGARSILLAIASAFPHLKQLRLEAVSIIYKFSSKAHIYSY